MAGKQIHRGPRLDSAPMGFDRNVFVNCPFDDDYLPILRALLFTVTYLGFQPRIALESRDSGQSRIDTITALIRESKYAIHDLSRIKVREVQPKQLIWLRGVRCRSPCGARLGTTGPATLPRIVQGSRSISERATCKSRSSSANDVCTVSQTISRLMSK